MIETLLIALSLSMDAFAVSLSAAACSKRLTRFHAIRAAFAFGLFQFLMPIAGWLLGTSFSALISGFDHWVAFGLLALVGGKMLFEVYEEWKDSPDPNACPADAAEKRDLSSKRIVLALAVATSIDALAVGVGFAAIGTNALVPATVIGIVTFSVCALAFAIGKRVGLALGRHAQLAGGVVLVGIGAKILFDHLLAR